MDNNRKVADFVSGTRYADIPEGVRHKTKLAFLDALGAALSGSLVDVTKISIDFANKSMPGDQATMILGGGKASEMGAAFVNANAANAFDTDDDNPMVKGHIGAQLVAAALATAEAEERSGQDLITGLAVAFEVGFRAGWCWHEDNDIWRGCGSWGTIPNAAASAHLKGLNSDQTWHTLGIADYHAPMVPMLRDLANPAMVKHAMGWAATTGIAAADLAQLGYTGVPSLMGFDGYARVIGDIGEVWHMEPVLGFKEIPGIAYGHLLIYALRDMRAERSIEPDNIKSVFVEAFHDSAILPQVPPNNTEEAQFSAKWPLACELYFGKYSPLHQLAETLKDPGVLEMYSKIELVEKPEFTELYDLVEQGDPDGRFISQVTVITKDGEHFTKSCSLTSFGHMLDERGVADKFRDLVNLVLPEAHTEEIIEMVMRMDELPTLDPLIDLIK